MSTSPCWTPSPRPSSVLIARGKERGYITFDELNAVLPPDQKQFGADRRRHGDAERDRHPGRRGEEAEEGEPAVAKPDKEAETEDEPTATWTRKASAGPMTRVRMYLREMGSVELLSREGEIRDRQAHRGWPRHDDRRPLREPADVSCHYRLA